MSLGHLSGESGRGQSVWSLEAFEQLLGALRGDTALLCFALPGRLGLGCSLSASCSFLIPSGPQLMPDHWEGFLSCQLSCWAVCQAVCC